MVATIIRDRWVAVADIDLKNLTDRDVAVWSEPDPEHRRVAVRELWSTDGVHVLQPPQEMRRAASGLRFGRLVLKARGHHELEVRVTRAYEEFIARAPSCSVPAGMPSGSTTWPNFAGRWCLATVATWPVSG
ncbi:hypothetical protein ABZ671_27415 [Micromonospora sp. NPDC006766]|uniref:hypothetical protein n=1 Tax=Micromonospora sp. NPDC006766 TaxID=3154778 RepID=UPI0033C7DB73